jgi:gliding motility-associated-like protein
MRSLQDKMTVVRKYSVILLQLIISVPVLSQRDSIRPEAPLFNMLTIDQVTGNVVMTWSLSPSGDVAGYIVYLYQNGAGHPIDSIFNPAANSYTVFRPGISKFSESYVIAAIDSSHNYSPLSNALNTIYAESKQDTCNNRINVTWNKYASTPVNVTGYDVFASINGSSYSPAGHVSSDITSFAFEEFTNGSVYCFLVSAVLANGMASGSNKPCSEVKIQNPPAWINGDYATVTDAGEISLSFTFDPASEIKLFSLERKSGASGVFNQLARIGVEAGSVVTFTDKSPDPDDVNTYRLSAINNCGLPVIFSNAASDILLSALAIGNEINLKWNENRKWRGSVASYTLFTDKGTGFVETVVLGPSDTSYTINIQEIMYDLPLGKVCFYVKASEAGNPFGITGESISTRACITLDEVITVPNLFTPNNDLKNDLFKPVLSFSPSDYHLVITDRQGKILFETRNFLDTWDGTVSGSPVPEGVYLWFLKVRNQEGKNTSRTGTVTIYRGK